VLYSTFWNSWTDANRREISGILYEKPGRPDIGIWNRVINFGTGLEYSIPATNHYFETWSDRSWYTYANGSTEDARDETTAQSKNVVVETVRNGNCGTMLQGVENAAQAFMDIQKNT